MINAIILGFASAAMTCFIYYISGKPYEHEGEAIVGEEGQILETFGLWLVEAFGAPCLVCVNTWVAGVIACFSLILSASTLLEAALSIGIAFIALKTYQKLGVD